MFGLFKKKPFFESWEIPKEKRLTKSEVRKVVRKEILDEKGHQIYLENLKHLKNNLFDIESIVAAGEYNCTHSHYDDIVIREYNSNIDDNIFIFDGNLQHEYIFKGFDFAPKKTKGNYKLNIKDIISFKVKGEKYPRNLKIFVEFYEGGLLVEDMGIVGDDYKEYIDLWQGELEGRDG